MHGLPGTQAKAGVDPRRPFAEGAVSLDFQGKAPGRGAYLCPDPNCLKKAMRSKSLERNLEAAIPVEVLERLAREMEAHHET